MHNSLLSTTFLFLSVLFTTALAASPADKNLAIELLVRRQTTTDPTAGISLASTGNTSPACLDYAATANLSTVASNSTYRSAFISKSPVGTLADQRMLNAAKLKLPALTQNATLNQECGNYTAIAKVEAEKNFTQGIVLQFSGYTPQGIKAGPEVVAIVMMVCIILCGTWIFMP